MGLNIQGHSPYSVAGPRAGGGEGPRPPSRNEAGWGPRPNSRSGEGSRLTTPAGRPLSRNSSHAGLGVEVRLSRCAFPQAGPAWLVSLGSQGCCSQLPGPGGCTAEFPGCSVETVYECLVAKCTAVTSMTRLVRFH